MKKNRLDIKKTIKKRIEDKHKNLQYLNSRNNNISNNATVISDHKEMNDRLKRRIVGDPQKLTNNVIESKLITREERRIGIIKQPTMNNDSISNKNIGVIVVNLNQLKLTINCIKSLHNQINKNFQIYLFDQNSNEIGTEEYLIECEENNIIVFRNDENVPLNYLWNNFKNITECEYLCFLNNDIVITNTFIDDNIKIFQNESTVGGIVHVTNNLNFLTSKNIIDYKILNPSLYQGWDFTIKRELMPEIPKSLKIFGGDDYIFARINSLGYKVAIAYSSPIIHYKEVTRNTVSNIETIRCNDGVEFRRIMQNEKLIQIDSTMNHGISSRYPQNNMKLSQNKNCVYTAIIGDYDDLYPTEHEKLFDWDYICFTNNENIKSDFWRVIYINDKDLPINNNDNVNIQRIKFARYFKTNFHNYLSSYDNIMWIDARITILGNLNEYLKHLNNKDIVFLKHPNASSIDQEFTRVLFGKLEKQDVIEKIKNKYTTYGYNYDNGLISSGVMLFKNNKKTIKFFHDWWREIYELSHRDQLSANFVLWKNPNIKCVMLPNMINKYFRQLKRKSKRFVYE